MSNSSILIVDDNKNVLSALEILLRDKYKVVYTLNNPNQISSFQHLADLHLILLDMNFSAGINSGNEGLFWLREIKKRAPHVSVIMMTAYGSIDLAVKALRIGAVDFILKPWNNEKLLTTINSTLELQKSKKEVQQLKQVINHNKNLIIGKSKSLLSVLNLTRKVAKTDVNVLIIGENGTGKELIARELHQQSNRKEEVFISVDMGSISESLFESELFGHIKGSFTDAKEDRVGRFEAAHKGTLFLDEIGNLSLQSQSKLLSAIQNKTIVRVGSNKTIPVDIRLVCATNCNLEQMVAEGLFREDLLYRINTIQIDVPPLRERKEDILIIADFYLKKFQSRYNKSGIKINQKAQEKLTIYKWPGNIRELQHVIERSIILTDGSIIKPENLLLRHKKFYSDPSNSRTLEEMESIMIAKALDEHNGNFSAAAEQLGISRQTLYNKMKKQEIHDQ